MFSSLKRQIETRGPSAPASASRHSRSRPHIPQNFLIPARCRARHRFRNAASISEPRGNSSPAPRRIAAENTPPTGGDHLCADAKEESIRESHPAGRTNPRETVHFFPQISVAGGDDPHVQQAHILLPSRLILCSSRVRSSFTCMAAGISATSSRKNVPPSACSSRPFCPSLPAPENAPAS